LRIFRNVNIPMTTFEDALYPALKTILLIVSALFPIVNPLGNAPIFLTLTKNYSAASRRLLSRRIAFNSFFLLVASFFIGTNILAFFGISIPVVQVGGGLLVISTGWAMLKEKDDPEPHSDLRKTTEHAGVFRKAFYPLTLPLTVGPGSISVAITLGANAPHRLGQNFLSVVAAVIGAAIIALIIFLSYGFADRLAQLIGATAMGVIMRLSSFLLVCIGVQIFWNGASVLLGSLPEIIH
jgi:multiple antibiotic resistance protein